MTKGNAVARDEPGAVQDDSAAVAAVSRVGAVSSILELLLDSTGLGFGAVARVTETSWTACAVLDRIGFGLPVGGQLEVATTFCSEIRASRTPIVIDQASTDQVYCTHRTPRMYGFESYIAVPIILRSGEIFGTICALDPKPAKLSEPKTLKTLELFAELIGSQLELDETLADLKAEREYLHNLFRQMPSMMSVVRGPDHVLEMANDAYRRLVGEHRTLVGRPMREALPEIASQGFFDLRDQVYRTGRPHIGRSQRVLLASNPDGGLEEHFLDFIYQPMKDGDGRVIGIFSEAIDVTDHKRALDHQGLLINELNHRVKNTLATVQSIAFQSLKNAQTMEHAHERLESRLMALARVHDVLTRESWDSAELRTIVHQAISPFESVDLQRFVLSGPAIKLPPRQVLPLSMAVHELLTNALKYGALSVPSGWIAISWDLGPDGGDVRFRWEENGGPTVQPPSVRGFGTRLIERGLAQELGGTVTIEFDPSGVICAITFPLI
ncbi:HWE histidine kinase domain-containing protein [Microvirga sp. CF3016]|uniref:HWE histidine kinase domain-containing protein n=1 Tax=Microvirga sp. CF3016 TaxID=3110181 RepID=UPI002E77EA40|nr:HWE histidine kinase domain-containing protein [Microvirga sp. CF3016]MEE1613105.1 HWE histidine kinase domain-containing protein [Microvirga sp. CF3016]